MERDRSGLRNGDWNDCAAVSRSVSDLERIRAGHPELQPREITVAAKYHSEHEAIRLLHTLGNAYEPLHLTHWIRKMFSSRL